MLYDACYKLGLVKIEKNRVIAVIDWYKGSYRLNRQELSELQSDILSGKIQFENSDALEDLCQRICNPGDYTEEEEDPVNWREYM
jgi:hypothetical protein